MERERYERIRSVFHAVCDAAPDEQERQLERLCAGDADLREEVRRLLDVEANEARSAAMSDLAARVQEQLADELGRAGASEPPAAFGAYRITREIGSGGMGTVYEAEQEFPRRTVALKIIRPGLVTEALLKRFEYEAHVLGLLQHPGIAQIHEAGTAMTDAGPQAFFAMELAHGRTLREYVRSEEPDVATRLRIVAELCEAIHHAHTRGVVHRDLKPSNIVVDDVGHPKILDFGVARMTESDLRTTTLRTGMGELIGTVPYMSPEQAAGNSDDVDTRTDVYALGVILFELLAGALPHEVEGSPIHEAVRTIREDEPRSLSSFGRHLRGDLETIVETALAKDKARRYQTAIELAADIRRHIEDQPIVARPPSALYQLRKFAKRNKALVGGLTATLLALLVGVGGTSYGMWHANEQRERAEGLLREASAAREEAEAVTDFTVRMIGMASPEGTGREVRVVDVLELAASEIGSETLVSPGVRVRLLDAMGSCFLELGQVARARELMAKGLALGEATLGSDHALSLSLRSGLGTFQSIAGMHEDGIHNLETAFAGQRRTHGATDRRTIRSMVRLGSAYMRNAELERANAILNEAMVITTATFPSSRIDRTTKVDVARARYAAGQLEGAAQLCEEILAHADSNATDYATIRAKIQLAAIKRKEGAYVAAKELYDQARVACDSRYGPRALPTAHVMMSIARIAYLEGDWAGAESLVREHMGIVEEHYPSESDALNDPRNLLASILFDTGRFAEAEDLLAESLQFASAASDGQSPQIVENNYLMGCLRMRQGKYGEAAKILEDAVMAGKALLGQDSPTAIEMEHDWALCLARSGDRERAETVLLDLIGRTRASLGAHPRVCASMMTLARLLATTGRTQDASAIATEAADLVGKTFPEGHPIRVFVLAEWGSMLLDSGDLGAARSVFLRVRSELLAAEVIDEVRLRAINDVLQQLDE